MSAAATLGTRSTSMTERSPTTPRPSASIPKNATPTTIGGSPGKPRSEHDKAIADFNDAIRLDPKNAWAYSNRGRSWLSKRDFDKALTDFNAAIQLDPKASYPLYFYCILRLTGSNRFCSIPFRHGGS